VEAQRPDVTSSDVAVARVVDDEVGADLREDG
jgi:hypothetical protein